MNLQDYISISIIFVYIIPVVLYLITNNTTHITALTGLIGITCVSEFVKYYIIGDISVRPKGATNCNTLCNDGICQNNPGMPSSHSAIVCFFSGFYIQQTDHLIVQMILIVYAYLVMLSRHLKRCHTLYQIGAGSILGFSASFIVLKKTLMLKDI